MVHKAFWEWADYLWVAAGLVWLATAALRTKATVRIASAWSTLGHVLIMVAAFFLLFNRALGLGPLDVQIVSASPDTDAAGFAVTVAGIAFALWARFFLGRNWSSSVTVKQDHELIRRGPYRIVRHPIYSGFLLAAAGTALIHGRVRDFVGFGLAFLGWWLKSRMEEKFMVEQFDGEYLKYRQQVKGFVPYLL